MVSDSVGGNLNNILKESDAPTDQCRKNPGFVRQVPEVSVPSESHKDIATAEHYYWCAIGIHFSPFTLSFGAERAVNSKVLLFRYLYFLIQKLRCYISSVRPAESVEVRVNREFPEGRDIFQRFKYFTVKLPAQIHITFCPVRKPDVNRKALLILCFHYFRYHLSTPMAQFSSRDDSLE